MHSVIRFRSADTFKWRGNLRRTNKFNECRKFLLMTLQSSLKQVFMSTHSFSFFVCRNFIIVMFLMNITKVARFMRTNWKCLSFTCCSTAVHTLAAQYFQMAQRKRKRKPMRHFCIYVMRVSAFKSNSDDFCKPMNLVFAG